METQRTYWDEQSKLDAVQQNANAKSSYRDSRSKTDVFYKELRKNMCKVYNELKENYDCDREPNGVAKYYYSFSLSGAGWNNIDKQVLFATLNRETTTISLKGKSSTLTYNDWKGIITDYENYDRINVYNIPKSINSYVKIQGRKG